MARGQAKRLYGIDRLRETLVVKEATRKSMQGNRSKDTKPEVALRKALWARGLRGYRKNVRKLPGTPDIVFASAKLAIFVHGCFWHGCPTCSRNLTPKTNSAFWSAKRAQNRQRDERNTQLLSEMGYRVITIWECEIEDTGVATVSEQIARLIAQSEPQAAISP